jgi:O-antigen/teichoic acid export membrane protein
LNSAIANLYKSTFWLFILQCVSLVLAFLVNYFLVKATSLEVYGTYVYIFNLLNIVAAFSILGTDTLLIRKIAVYKTKNDDARIKGVIHFSMCSVLVGSLIAAVIFRLLNHQSESTSFSISVPLLAVVYCVITGATTVFIAALQGFRKILLSQLADKLLRPLLFISVVTYVFYQNRMLNLDELVWLNLTVIAGLAFLNYIFFYRHVYHATKPKKAVYEFGAWAKLASSILAINLLFALNSKVDILLLGKLYNKSEVGVYNIAIRISELIGFVLSVINIVIAPSISELYTRGERAQLQTLITRSAMLVLIATVPIFLFIILCRKYLLLFFGAQFLDGQTALWILCVGQFINVLFGSVGTLLLMSGNQKYSIISLVASVILNVLVNIFLTPHYGIIGTAIATAISICVWNMVMYFFVRKRLNIRTTAFGIV